MTSSSWQRSPFSTDLPRYVEYGGDPSGRHPAAALDIRFYGFPLQADADLLDEFCDRVFNRPSGGQECWQALGGHVLLNFVNTRSLGSRDPLDQWLGVVEERETAIWIPVIDVKRGRMAWAIGFMFVDSGMALVGGRETYGFPKQLGHSLVPRTDDAPTELLVSAVTFKEYGPDQQAERHEVIRAERLLGGSIPLEPAWDEPSDAFVDLVRLMLHPSSTRGAARTASSVAAGDVERALAKLRDPTGIVRSMTTGIEVALMLMHDFAAAMVPMVLLKQFRDTEITTAACYQAIVECENTVLEFRSGGILNGYTVRINDLAGEPIGRELGVALEQTPPLGIFLEFSFLVQLGRILWEAAPPQGRA